MFPSGLAGFGVSVMLLAVSGLQDAPLRALADARGKLIGTAVNTTVLARDARYSGLVASTFSSVTPENVMKWQLVEPERGVYNYGPADQLVDFARANGQSVRGHTLVWHNQVPRWVTSGDFSGAELADVLHAHIAEEVNHFAGELYAWEVVNEPFNDNGTWRNSIWYRSMGPDYVAQALQWAHAADPTTKLYLNDYNIEAINPKSDALYALAHDLLAHGVPLDGIGVQAHLRIQSTFPASLTANLQRFADLGLDVAITEADVRMMMPPDDDKLARQADYFQSLMRSCLAVDRCVSYTVWGFTDAHSWVPNAYRDQGAATLLDYAYNAKPAFATLRETLMSP